jgi:hypothetical protein
VAEPHAGLTFRGTVSFSCDQAASAGSIAEGVNLGDQTLGLGFWGNALRTRPSQVIPVPICRRSQGVDSCADPCEMSHC